MGAGASGGGRVWVLAGAAPRLPGTAPIRGFAFGHPAWGKFNGGDVRENSPRAVLFRS